MDALKPPGLDLGRDERGFGFGLSGRRPEKKHALWGPKRPPQRVGLPGGGTYQF